jgi:hypothetical protein
MKLSFEECGEGEAQETVGNALAFSSTTGKPLVTQWHGHC